MGAQLQDLTQVSATQTGWRRTHRSGEGKMIAFYGRGICSLRYRSFPAFFRLPEFSGELTCEKNEECAQGGIDLMPFRLPVLA